jgi:CheY-like chemotaxis protein
MAHKLLLADDSVTIQRVIELTFADEDIIVTVVGDGQLAIERLDIDPPDIILADVDMPKRDGYEVAAYVKSRPKLAHIPVVLLTGAFEPIDQARATAAGSSDVLAKPFEPQMVINRVKELLGKRRQEDIPEASAPEPQVAPAPMRPQPQSVPPPKMQAPVAAPQAVQSAKPPVAEPTPAGRAASAESQPVSLDDYFDQLDAAFSNLQPGAPASEGGGELDWPLVELPDSAADTKAPQADMAPPAAETASSAMSRGFLADRSAPKPADAPKPAVAPPSVSPAPSSAQVRPMSPVAVPPSAMPKLVPSAFAPAAPIASADKPAGIAPAAPSASAEKAAGFAPPAPIVSAERPAAPAPPPQFAMADKPTGLVPPPIVILPVEPIVMATVERPAAPVAVAPVAPVDKPSVVVARPPAVMPEKPAPGTSKVTTNPFANLSAAKAEAASRPASVITDEVIEEIVSRVLTRLSDRVVRETVTEIVSQTAERLVQEEIEKIKLGS